MPQYIVKPNRGDEDFYVYWDTVTDSPWGWGTRAELEEDFHLRDMTPERFTRADTTGTSSRDGFFGWDYDEFTVMNMGDEPFVVERRNLVAWLTSIVGDGDSHTTWDVSLTKEAVFGD